MDLSTWTTSECWKYPPSAQRFPGDRVVLCCWNTGLLALFDRNQLLCKELSLWSHMGASSEVLRKFRIERNSGPSRSIKMFPCASRALGKSPWNMAPNRESGQCWRVEKEVVYKWPPTFRVTGSVIYKKKLQVSVLKLKLTQSVFYCHMPSNNI